MIYKSHRVPTKDQIETDTLTLVMDIIPAKWNKLVSIMVKHLNKLPTITNLERRGIDILYVLGRVLSI